MTSGIDLTTPSIRARQDLADTARGILGESVPSWVLSSGAALVDGTVYFGLVGLRAGDVVTNVVIDVSSAGVAVTLSKVGLYDKAGNRLGLSADQGTAWQSTGIKTVALTAAYTVPVDDGYYAAVVAKATTTVPSLYRFAPSVDMSLTIGAGVRRFGTLATQTDLPATATIGAATLLPWLVLT